LDGTLAASEVLKARALAQACASYGAQANHLIYADVMGEDWPAVTRHFFKRCEGSDRGGLSQHRDSPWLQ
jgi:beta-phosphoglucomutase-like phosphatase (HAD superfamily)